MAQIQIVIAGETTTAEQIAEALSSALQGRVPTGIPAQSGPLSVDQLNAALLVESRELDAEEVMRQLDGDTEMHPDDLTAFVSGIDNRLVFESLEKFQQYARTNLVDGDSLVISDVSGQVVATYRR
jgi:hypothetical protein|nr:MAG TPA: hypothetical protein [Bacteriophage sp.]